MAAKKILHQFDVQAVTSISNPGTGYVGFSAKADGLYQKIGAGSDLRLLTTSDAASYQPVDADLTAIAGVGGDVGFLRKTNVNTWILDSSTYALSTHTHAGAYEPVLGNPGADGYVMVSTAAGVRSWTSLAFSHSISTHSDVTFTGNPISGDIMQHNGVRWTQRNLITAGIAALAGSTTQAFSTHHLALGNGSGNGPILTLYGSAPSVFSTIKTTNGNPHIDPHSSGALYLNYYAGTGGVVFGNGATGLSGASVSAAGLITAPSLKLTIGAGAGKVLTSDADGDATWAELTSMLVPAASDSSPGTVEIATTAEVLAMTDMLRSLTPYTLANAFPNSTGTNGWIGIPCGFGQRILIQWGSFSSTGNGTITFPVTFLYFCYSVVITAGDGIARIPSKTKTSFVWNDVVDAITSAIPCNWIAIGK